MTSSFVQLHGLRVVAVTWNCNSRIEANVDLIRRQLLGLSDENDPESSNKAQSSSQTDGNELQPAGSACAEERGQKTECSESNSGNCPDLIIVGLQEIIELSTSSVLSSAVIGQNSLDQVDQWQGTLLKALNGSSDENQQDSAQKYYLVARQHMVGVAVFVFTIQGLEKDISQVQVSTLARGVGGVLGNKGAVYARMKIQDSTLCIVNAHFTPHREHVERRNEDYFAILTYPAFTNELYLKAKQLDNTALDPPALSRCKQQISSIKKRLNHFLSGQNGETNKGSLNNISGTFTAGLFSEDSSAESSKYSAEDHDIVIWLGDLNYRIIKSLHIDTVYDLIEKQNIDLLSDFDQLTIEKDSGNIFQYFNEGLLFFPPTYQFTPFKDEYNKNSKKQRVPAWCDRILWRIGKRKTTKQVVNATEDTEEEEAGEEGSEKNNNDMTVDISETGPIDLKPTLEEPKRKTSADDMENIVNTTATIDSDDEESENEITDELSEQAVTPSRKEERISRDIRRNSMYIRRNSIMLADIDITIPDGDRTARISSSSPRSSRHHSISLHPTEALIDSVSENLSMQNEKSVSNPLQYPVSYTLIMEQQQEDSVFQERIELMEYTVCEGLLMSDHKPVRAVLNMKVKKMNWEQYESSTSSNTFNILSDPHYPLKAPSNIDLNKNPFYPNYAFISSAAHIPYLHFSPCVINLKSVTSDGDRQYLTLYNDHQTYALHYMVCDSSCSRWLEVLEVHDNTGVIPPGERKTLIIGNIHSESTLKLVEDVDTYSRYDEQNLPHLSKLINLPPNDSKMNIYATLAIKFFLTAEDEQAQTTNTRLGALFQEVEEVFVPVICSLSI